ncbi:MAG: CsbD family protein [Haloechinothrix sp.]
MSIFDKVRDKAEQLLRGAKEKVGEDTGNERLADSGKADQFSGEAKEAAHDAKDKITGSAKDAKDDLTDQ